jgi:uncharacterized membrane protein
LSHDNDDRTISDPSESERHPGSEADQLEPEPAPSHDATGTEPEELRSRSLERSGAGDRNGDNSRAVLGRQSEEHEHEQALIERAVEAIVVAQSARSWIGPLPHPEVLAQYEEVVPGSGTRIIAMAESETTEKAATDRLLAEGEIESTKSGVAVAGALAFVCVFAAIAFFIVHNTVAGGIMLSIPVLTLIRAFIPDRHSKG